MNILGIHYDFYDYYHVVLTHHLRSADLDH